MNGTSDPRRPEKVLRYKLSSSYALPDDQMHEYMNVVGMVFSMVGLMMKIKWCAWIAVYCAFVGFANSKTSEDTKQVLSCFMLSVSAVVMSYLQSPTPMTIPFI